MLTLFGVSKDRSSFSFQQKVPRWLANRSILMFLVSSAKIVFSHHKYDATEPLLLLTNFLYSLVKDVTGATAFLLQKHWQDQHQCSILSIVNLGRQFLLPNRSQSGQIYTSWETQKINLFRRIHCYTGLTKKIKEGVLLHVRQPSQCHSSPGYVLA